MKILLIDIETKPALAYIWDLRTEYVSPDKIVTPGMTMCWSAKWFGEKEILFDSEWDSGNKEMVKSIYALLNQADAVVHYNGNKFDQPTLNREFLELGLPPPSPSRQIDLYPVVKRRFKFLSNKLDYVCKRLGLGGKVKHKGMELWTDCMAGDKSAQATMKKYNKGDVALLEKLYVKLLPWIPNHPNHGLYSDAERPICTHCGSDKLQRRGIARTTTQVYARFQCQGCGAWLRSAKVESKGKSLIRGA